MAAWRSCEVSSLLGLAAVWASAVGRLSDFLVEISYLSIGGSTGGLGVP